MMIPLSVAVLFSRASNSFLNNPENQESIYRILYDKTPYALLECVELIKSKVFGRGLGSRPQKIIRKVMESWDSTELEEFSVEQPKELYSLIRLIHPRYFGYSGKIIKALLCEKSKNVH